MSKYTTEVRYICETKSGLNESKGYTSVKEILSTSAPKIFDFEYPIFDEEYRLPLEIKILRHFYTREICEETVGLWLLRLEDKMNMIMPYYNQLYESALIKFNPLYDVDTTRKRDKKGNTDGTTTSNGSSNTDSNVKGKTNTSGDYSTDTEGKTNSENNSESNSNGKTNGTTNKNANDWDYYSDTPQGGIAGVDKLTYLTNLRNKTGSETTTTQDETESSNKTEATGSEKYSSTVVGENSEDTTTETKGNNKTVTEGRGTSKLISTEEYVETVQGKQGSKSNSAMLLEFRETFLNIDKMVIEEMNDLFFGLWE